MSELDGGTAVVAGAGSGLGEAMVDAFAAEGMRIAALDINREAAESVAARLAGTGTDALDRVSTSPTGPRSMLLRPRWPTASAAATWWRPTWA